MSVSRFLEDASTLSRRNFLKVTSLSGIGFAIGSVSISDVFGAAAKGPSEMGHFVKIDRNGLVTVVIKHLDKGQGVTTGLAAIVAEELDAEWEQMRWEFAPSDPTRYNNLLWGPYQGTGGSTAVANSWMQLRQAGAAARDMLCQAAASEWGVKKAELTVRDGVIRHPSGKRAGFGTLAEKAAEMPPPAEPTLKKPDEFKIIGRSDLHRLDNQSKTTGKAEFTVDVKLPGMKTAVVQHPPRFGAQLKSVDDKAARAVEGVVDVITIPRGVAVIADNYWSANKGRSALVIEWDESHAEMRSTDELVAEYKALAETEGVAVRQDGDVSAALKEADQTIELDFEFPYLSHAQMEPLNCAVEKKGELWTVYTGSQLPTVDSYTASKILGTELSNIHVQTLLAGGSFGRRAVPDSDFVAEAVMIAKAIDGAYPVSLQWSREDDIQAGRYRPLTVHKGTLGLKDGKLDSWRQRVVSQSILRGTPFEAMIQGPVDFTVVEGVRGLPYQVPNLQVEAHETKVGIPVLWWRSVGHTHTAYATEVLLDEAAHTLKKDPVAYRLELLGDKHPRLTGVLNLAAEKSGWGKDLPANKALGVALHESFSSFVAQVAEVTLEEGGAYHVDKITCAVDCGIAVTPDVIKAQMEGGIGMGLGAAQEEQITLTNGKVDQSNFHTYFPMRINRMPEIDVHIVPSAENPTGVGEPGLPPAAPAVANALRVLTGKPITKLPFGHTINT